MRAVAEIAVAGCGHPSPCSIATNALRPRFASSSSASVLGSPGGRAGSRSNGKRTMRDMSVSRSARLPEPVGDADCARPIEVM